MAAILTIINVYNVHILFCSVFFYLMYIYIDFFSLFIMIEGTLKWYSKVGNFLLPLSKFCFNHFTFHGDIGYFAYMLSP